MIVQCDKCRTKYRIADEKVTGKGVKVRCAKCGNVFIVKPPVPPEPAPSPTPLDSPAPPHETIKIPSQPEGPAEPPSDDTASTSKPPPGSHGFQPFAPSPGGLGDLATHPLPESSFENPVFSDEPLGRTDDAFSQADQGSTTGLPASDTLTDSPADGALDWGNIPLGSEDGQDGGGPEVDLAPPPVQAPSPDPDVPPRGFETEATRVESRQVAAQPEKKGGKGLVLFLVLVLLGAGGYFARPKIIPLIERITGRVSAEKPGILTVKDSRFGSIKRSDGITLVTVRGVVMNNTGKKQGMIRIVGQFKGADGGILAESASFCGNILSDEDLNLMPMGKIRSALQNELGQSLSNAAVASGKSVPFLLILENPSVGKIREVTFTVKSDLGRNKG